MSDGPMLGRFRISSFVVSESRDTVYDGSTRGDNSLSERTSITVPILMVDYRVSTRLGLQVSTTVPYIARTGVVHQSGGDLAFRDAVHGLGDTNVVGWYHGGNPLRWHWTYVTSGVGVMVAHALNAQAEIKLPMYRHLANRQLDSDAILQFGISRQF